MPFVEVKITPSVNIEPTPTDNQTGISTSNFIRWRGDLPEKRGGCTLYINQRVDGAPVALKPWGDFQGDSFLGIATPSKVYTYGAETLLLKDVSPQYYISPLASPTFTTTVGSAVVGITDATQPSGIGQFDSVQFITPISVGGLILNGTYPIQSVTGPSSYNIVVPYPATSAVSGIAGTLPKFSAQSSLSRIIVDFPIQYQFNSLVVGDRIGFAGTYTTPSTALTTVGGIPIIGSYIVSQISTSTEFIFQAQYTATSTQFLVPMNSGYAYLVYWITQPPGAPP